MRRMPPAPSGRRSPSSASSPRSARCRWRRAATAWPSASRRPMIGDPVLWRLLEDRGAAALRRDEASRYAIIERSARLKLDDLRAGPLRDRRATHAEPRPHHWPRTRDRERLSAEAWRCGRARHAGCRSHLRVDAVLTRISRARLDDLLGSLGYTLRHSFDESGRPLRDARDKKRAHGPAAMDPPHGDRPGDRGR